MSSLKPILHFLSNILLVYLLYMVCRVIYILEFWDLYASSWDQLSLSRLLAGSLRFDTSAIIYTNILYALLVLPPYPRRWVSSRTWQLIAKTLFVVVNSLMLSVNLVDTVYSRYTGRRTTCTFFTEFSNEGNLGSIVGIELLNHWYLVLAGLAMIALLVWLYRSPFPDTDHSKQRFRWLNLICFLAYIPLAVIGMRGGASTAIRPITISNANQYVNRPSEAAIVLNTPFSLIRTLGKTTFSDPAYFTPSQLDSIYSPLHQPINADSLQVDTTRRNVVVLIVESFGSEYIGALNNGQGHTPFLDSLIGQSLTFTHSYSNGRKSIDGMPSILSGIPMFVEPFFVTGYSLNDVSGLAGELSRSGYTSAFFHGAENGSMGFEAFARTSGFQSYYGRTEYNRDPRFNGDDDFDGTWAIWDEEFLQFYAATMQQMPQPFVTALFTATSHHPFVVPQRYRDSLHEPGHPIYTCVRYTDHALRRFFHTASQMPWYRNTIFVITADHTNITEQPAYNNPLGTYSVPIIFFDPSGTMPRGRIDAVAQQTDIMPTILGWLAYPHPYIAFGDDLIHTPANQTWALHYNNGVYQHVQQNYLLLFDGEKAVGYYDLNADPYQQNNLLPSLPPHLQPLMQTHLDHTKGIIQSYMQRMVNNQLTIDSQPRK